ncbi:hypothetical protein [Clostridium akagii]|uniref:hypothetical protein n=1 Tax=Clostridium akagii TaxID=91623 RepID=UPI00047DA9CE|nr:hypothetical protein [Clostridium akagii]
MYCVIQKVENKKPNTCGEAKELKVDTAEYFTDGKPKTCYGYKYTGKFERPIKTAYKISIHKSFRESGKVRKKQWVLCTMGYYALIEYCLYDFADGKITKVAEETGISIDDIYNMVNEKLEPIIDEATKEYEATEEYKTKVKNLAIYKKYCEAKVKFESKFGKGNYDYCYDIFGVLRNEEYLKELETSYKSQQEYNRSYYENFKSNYDNFNFSGYSNSKGSNYTEDEKGKLKRIYGVLATKFHPDVSKDDGEMMKLVNRLKDEWQI